MPRDVAVPWTHRIHLLDAIGTAVEAMTGHSRCGMAESVFVGTHAKTVQRVSAIGPRLSNSSTAKSRVFATTTVCSPAERLGTESD
jgi:hypothetical protein